MRGDEKVKATMSGQDRTVWEASLLHISRGYRDNILGC